MQSLLSPQVTSSTSTVSLTTQVLLTPAQISDSCSQLPPLTAPPSYLNVVILLCPMTSLVFWEEKRASIHKKQLGEILLLLCAVGILLLFIIGT